MALGPFFVGEKPSFTFTIRDKDTDDIIDLTELHDAIPVGKARVLLRKVGTAANREATADEIATVVSTGSQGVITYPLKTAWATGEVGQWDAQIVLNFTAGVRKTERFRFTVEAALVPA